MVYIPTHMNSSSARHSPRTYRMEARAEAVAETGRRILSAVVDLHNERFHDQITLEDIAGRAGVTVQTVLRRFGSKDGLLEAAAEWTRDRVDAQRREAPVGDVAGAVDNLLDHYDEMGEGVVRLLAQEERVVQFGPILDTGRRMHYRWVEDTFRPFLERAGHPERLRVQLIAVTDVYVWKVLAIDLGLERQRLREALIGMIDALIEEDT
jgi:AcrR family transcriptional regulator